MSTARPFPRGRPRSPALDEAILEAALELMGEHGYARMSIDAVARRAGTTKPSVYLRFSSKEELAVTALELLRARGEELQSGATRADLELELRRFQRGASRPHGMSMLGTVLAEQHQTPRLLRLFRKRIVAPRRARLRGVLERAQGRGEVSAEADLDLAVNMMVGAFYAQYLAGQRFPRDWAARTADAGLASLSFVERDHVER